MIITIGGIKGGTGKTTIATSFASIAAGLMGDVLLVDADEQESASVFAVVRREQHPDAPPFTTIKLTGQNVRYETTKLASKYAHIIIDTGGRDTTSQRAALSVSDRVLVPFAPRCFDVWTAYQASSLIEMMRTVNPTLAAYAIINRADPPGQGTDNADAQRLIQTEVANERVLEYLDAPLGNRKVFAHATSHGLAVTELHGDLRNQKACDEIMMLYSHCIDLKKEFV